MIPEDPPGIEEVTSGAAKVTLEDKDTVVTA